MKTRKMLVIRFSALGDVAMTLPVIYSLAVQYPDLQITVLTTPFFARLFINRPKNIKMMPVDLRGDNHGVRGLIGLARKLQGMDFDAVADLHNVMRSWVLDLWLRLCGAKVCMVNKGRWQRVALLRHTFHGTVCRYTDRYADVFGSLGCPVELTFRSLFDGVAVSPPLSVAERAVGVSPFARYPNKSLSVEQTSELVRLLVGHGCTIYLFGGRGEEKETLQTIADEPHVLSLAGRYSIEQELAIMSQLKVMVSMDSANHHLASLVGTPVISLWGSTTPDCGFMGYGQPDSRAVCLNLPCQPCTIAGSMDCTRGNMQCLRGLQSQSIVSKITSFL